MLDTTTAFDHLDASAPTPLSFAPDVHIRSFVLRRAAGDLLVYGAPEVPGGAPPVGHLLGHEHEEMFLPDPAPAPRVTAVDGPDIEIVPIPGHTPGSVALLWDSGEHRFLFTADTVMLDRGEWIAAVLDSSDRDAYLESLARLRELDFDVLVPWAATAGEPWFARTDRADARRRLDELIARVRAGASR